MPSQENRLLSALSDQYRIERELGRGGMATVYLAEDLKHQRKVAVKVLRPALAAVLGTERFLNEIRVTARLTHPNILPLLDSGETGGFLYYAMPYVDGQSLRDRLATEKKLPVADAVQITREVADALQHAHDHGIVHRDVKPENILFESGHAVVADFGIAKAVTASGGDALTETGIAVGTPAYMSPEQATGEHEIDGRSDVYSLSCVLYEMVTGQAPAQGSTYKEILTAKSLDRITPPRQLRPDLSKHLSHTITKGLRSDPTRRTPTAAEIREQVIRAASELEDLPRRKVQRRLIAVTVAAATIVASLGVNAYVKKERELWARTDGIADLGRLANSTDQWDSLYRLGLEIGSIIPDDTAFVKLWNLVTRTTSIRTEPPGGRVFRRSYGDADTSSIYLGETPLDSVRLPFWVSRLRIERQGFVTQDLVVFTWGPGVLLDNSRLNRQTIRLDSIGAIPDNMVRVTGFPLPRAVLGLEEATSVGDFLLDKFEVTNREFKEFVDAGGYRNRTHWVESFVRGGDTLNWEEAVRDFVDSSGQPGPSTWVAGSYADGDHDYPVSGVSWYEAAAYAHFRNKQLPGYWHWRAGLPTRLLYVTVPNSNIANKTRGPAPVGQFKGLGAFGTYDQAGNVREWTYNTSGEERLVAGAAWYDETYTPRGRLSESPWDRSPGNGFRLATYLEETEALDAALSPVPVRPPYGSRDYSTETPVGDSEFAVYKSMYEYTSVPLETRIERIDSMQHWIRERVSFTSAYLPERMAAYVYIPRHARPPYQTVMYWPSDNVLSVVEIENVIDAQHDYYLTAGRALVLPVYKGTLDRGAAFLGGELRPAQTQLRTSAHRDLVIQQVKDFLRTVEYVVTRPDIDTTRLAVHSHSWGGRYWPIVAVLEPRLKASVQLVGGLNGYDSYPEIDNFHFWPRVKIPVKMIAGEYDFVLPIETLVRPAFDMLGTLPEHKELFLYEGAHYVPYAIVAREALAWLDKYLGPVER